MTDYGISKKELEKANIEREKSREDRGCSKEID